ncbi:hypothetical protein GU808_08795 [Escherichia coli]|nr:hypothetical protein [Escherichia coli]EFO9333685.1 hypothetical protein [Escherichia coli]EGK2989090.1 hypothetical protein [Escherichia coli]
MSNIDKHAVQAVADLKAGYTLGHADVAILSELARIALASLEAEAVHQVYGNSDDTWSDVDEDEMIRLSSDGEDTRTLYTAPPAPASVPDEVSWEDVPEEITEYDMALASAWAHGFNQCRAAMLQGAEPVTTAYKLPPHIFRELVNRLRDTAVKYQGCQQLREQLSRTLQEVIQPAEPQQEVTQALAKGMERYGDVMQKLADSGD